MLRGARFESWQQHLLQVVEQRIMQRSISLRQTQQQPPYSTC
jgi:hypothetical protein